MNRLRHHHNIFNRPQVGSHPCLHGWRGIDAAVNLAAVVDHEIEADRTHVVLQLRANESPDFIDFQAGASAIAHHVALILRACRAHIGQELENRILASTSRAASCIDANTLGQGDQNLYADLDGKLVHGLTQVFKSDWILYISSQIVSIICASLLMLAMLR